MSRILVIVAFAAATMGMAGCRCESKMEGSEAVGEKATPGEFSSNAPMRWCRACALNNFTACKRVDGQESEETLRRKAELTACKDVGLTEEQCTESVLSHVKCGEMP